MRSATGVRARMPSKAWRDAADRTSPDDFVLRPEPMRVARAGRALSDAGLDWQQQ